MALNEVPMYQTFSVIGGGGHDVMPRQTRDPGKQAITPENRYTYTIFYGESYL